MRHPYKHFLNLLSHKPHSKPPTQTPKQKGLQKLLLSYFHNIIHLLDQLTEPDMLQLALAESAKIVPHVIGSRKAIRAYLKVGSSFFRSTESADLISCFCIEMSGVMVERGRQRSNCGLPCYQEIGVVQ